MKKKKRKESASQAASTHTHREVDFGTGGGSTHSRVNIDSSLPRPLPPGRTHSIHEPVGGAYLCSIYLIHIHSQRPTTPDTTAGRPAGLEQRTEKKRKKASTVKAKESLTIKQRPTEGPPPNLQPSQYICCTALHCSYVHTDRPTGIQVCRRSQAHRQIHRLQISTWRGDTSWNQT